MRCSSGRLRIRVYPRLCGGTSAITGRLASRTGLSPPVRGNLVENLAPDTQPRSIPACAGEPNNALRRLSTKPVYPRLCGGTLTPT